MANEWVVASVPALREAMLKALPGTRIVVSPGLYPVGQTLKVGQGGRVGAPIVLSARQPGTVWLAFSQVEGILVDQPHWVFENLHIRGECGKHDDCEHAFHVVGHGALTTIRNNHITNFNAHIKVNGLRGHWPDHGLVAFNTLTNTSARQTAKPVVMLDLVGASHWRAEDNLVTHFTKAQGNQISYGLFMKGASEGGRMERNLVVCSPENISGPGVRVGISFGGGTTHPTACRDGSCANDEHRHGLAANNIVAHCNDTGLDVNRSSQILLAHNTLINTSGIGLRGTPAQARAYGNLYEGVAQTRNGGWLQAEMNEILVPSQMFMNADGFNFHGLRLPPPVPHHPAVTNDFYLATRTPLSLPGALN
ncbi:hypothetical protein [Hydrogenophaga sp.]|uniref:hypothetical protein n=1 Tax=Hydrogenophaga sp. TaxID=1904254 RepID=UPI003F6BDCA1